ncbi:MAG: ubiquinol-cytochrome c reductase iron-sulfur subunit [Endozoicomonadaceae bacterium]|nr:ubiquinol-cytochrome c reductase iron-sulfur subunit [Endozoicomonadaceae bacterium]
MEKDGVNQERRRFLIATTSIAGAVGLAGAAIPFIKSWTPSEKAKAAGASVKVNIQTLEAGQQIIVEWRGRPIFLLRRTPEMLSNLKKNIYNILDPESKKSVQPNNCKNTFRSINDDLLVITGICTHLGCSPKYLPEIKPMPFDSKWQGGYHCPCHGSMFDLAGRVYKGVPAPTNLDVPPYYFENNDVIVIGQANEGLS